MNNPLGDLYTTLSQGIRSDIDSAMDIFVTKLYRKNDHFAATEIIRDFVHMHITSGFICNDTTNLSILAALLVDEPNCIDEYNSVCLLIQKRLQL